MSNHVNKHDDQFDWKVLAIQLKQGSIVILDTFYLNSFLEISQFKSN